MTGNAQLQQYVNNHFEGMSPEQLIFMLYKGALERIKLAKQGVEKNDPKIRGENIGKLIAIVAELYASLKPEMHDEGTEFLRGLYTSILMELPKVSITNDIKVLNRTEQYLSKLKDIWEKDVMGIGERDKTIYPPKSTIKKTPANPYGRGSTSTSFQSIAI